MAGRGRIVCAAGLVLVLFSGCIRAFVADWIEAGFWERAVPGEPPAVAAMLQANLGRMGLFASTSREGDTICLQSKTRSGKRFSLLISDSPTARGKVSMVRIRFEDERDQDFWLEFLGILDNKQAPAAPGQASARPEGMKQ
jgi:hypothetical protein